MFEYSSSRSVAALYTVNELEKMMTRSGLYSNLKGEAKNFSLKGGLREASLRSWHGRNFDSIKAMWEDSFFDAEPKEDEMSLDSKRLPQWEKLYFLLVPIFFSRMIFLDEKSKVLLVLMIFFMKSLNEGLKESLDLILFQKMGEFFFRKEEFQEVGRHFLDMRKHTCRKWISMRSFIGPQRRRRVRAWH